MPSRRIVLNIRFILVLVFVSVAYGSLSAAGPVVYGKVMAERDSLAVAGAECRLMKDSVVIGSSGSYGNGYFETMATEGGDMTLVILADDFDPYEVDISNLKGALDVGGCYLRRSSDLEELVVQADAYRMSKGKLMIIPDRFAVNASNKATDMLQYLGIPGLKYDGFDRTVTVDNSAVAILVNGIPADADILNSIKPSEVLSVEFTRNVPAMYAVYGSTLINIRLKPREEGGSVSIYNQNDFIGKRERLYASAGYHRGPSDFNIEYKFGFTKNYDNYNQLEEHYMSVEKRIDVNSVDTVSSIGRSHDIRFRYTYNPSEDFQLMGSVSLNALNEGSWLKGIAADSAMGSYAEHTGSKTGSMSPVIDFYALKRFGSSNTLAVNLTGVHKHTNYDYSNSYLGAKMDESFRDETRANRFALMSAISYIHSFGNFAELTTTYSNLSSRTKNDYLVSGNRFDITENNNKFTLDFSHSVRNVWYRLRAGITFDRLNDLDGPRWYVTPDTYWGVNWYLSRRWSLEYSGSYRPDNIMLNQLIDNPVRVNPYLVRNGNPHLKKSQRMMHEIAANFSSGIWRLRGGMTYHYAWHPVVDGYDYNPDENLFVRSPVNARSHQLEYVFLTGQVNGLLNMFNIMVNLHYVHSRSEFDDWKIQLNSFGADFGLTWKYRQWLVQYNRSFPYEAMFGYGWTSQRSFDSLTVGFTPDCHWDVKLSWYQLFNPKGYVTTTTMRSPYYQAQMRNENRFSGNMVVLAISYDLSFGNPFRRSGRSRSLQQTDVQSGYNRYD